VDRNGNLRPNCLAIAVLFLSVTCVAAQTAERDRPHDRIVGTVVDEQGHQVKNISVHAVLEQTGKYMPTVVSDDDSHFVIEDLVAGTYSIFGESDAAAYPDTALPFYSNKNPIEVTLGNLGTAITVLVLGPKAGVLCGTVVDRATRNAIASPHGLHFIVRKVSDRADSIEFAGPAKFRWLIPPATEVTLEVFAEGYKRWVYADSSDPLKPIPFRVEPTEERILNVKLEPEEQSTRQHQ
jgi:hypothetical protein